MFMIMDSRVSARSQQPWRTKFKPPRAPLLSRNFQEAFLHLTSYTTEVEVRVRGARVVKGRGRRLHGFTSSPCKSRLAPGGIIVGVNKPATSTALCLCFFMRAVDVAFRERPERRVNAKPRVNSPLTCPPVVKLIDP